MPTTAQLKIAYQRTALQREGISFEQAMGDAMFKMCLTRIATLIERKPTHIPLPKHPCNTKWQQFKDN